MVLGSGALPGCTSVATVWVRGLCTDVTDETCPVVLGVISSEAVW